MIEPAPARGGGVFEVLDIRSYIDGVFREADFREALRREEWSRFKDKRVLVKGCGKAPVPPWAYMLLLSHLGDYPKLVAYGEECAPVVVHRRRDSLRNGKQVSK